MRLLRRTNIDFIGRRKFGFFFSLLLILISTVSLIIHKGPRYGVDFTGGTLIQIRFEKPITIEEIRAALAKIGEASAIIQGFGKGNDFLIRVGIKKRMESFGEEVLKIMRRTYPHNPCQLLREELVGPLIGKELRKKALWAIIGSLLGILIYTSFRFDPRFGVGAVVALFHDVFITIGAISITNREVTIPVIAGLLTLAGYSVNDSIVVSDRIRENLRTLRGQGFDVIVNRGINDVLSRTVITSITTIAVALVLLILGAPAIRDFAFVLTVGILIGTYSSIFVVAPLVVEWEHRSPRRHRGGR